jgi:hypothetical protein
LFKKWRESVYKGCHIDGGGLICLFVGNEKLTGNQFEVWETG